VTLQVKQDTAAIAHKNKELPERQYSALPEARHGYYAEILRCRRDPTISIIGTVVNPAAQFPQPAVKIYICFQSKKLGP
jgi:hypothetical protein